MIRLSVSLFIVLYMLYSSTPSKAKQSLEPGECIRDQTFLAVESINKYFRAHIEVKNKFMIFASFLMDLM